MPSMIGKFIATPSNCAYSMLETLDRELFLALNGWGTEGWDAFFLAVTDKLHWIPLYLILLYHSLLFLGWRRTLLILLSVAALVALTDQTANLFKNGFGRLRPCHEEDLEALVRQVKSSCGGLYGYFSAHAANSMAVAVFFAGMFRERARAYAWPLLIWALLVGYSRIYIGVHYPGDVVSGFAIGALYGWLVRLGVCKLIQLWKLS